MIKSFNPSNGVVLGTVVNAPCANYFFVQNGDPKPIFCHVRQGGIPDVTAEGRFVLVQDDILFPPTIGERVALIRETNNPCAYNYGKASQWFMERDWCAVSWAINARTTFRAVGYDHRQNGHFASNSRTEVLLTQGTLFQIIRNAPLGAPNDALRKSYSTRVGNLTLTYSVRWERLDPDGKWTECTDPRPRHGIFS